METVIIQVTVRKGRTILILLKVDKPQNSKIFANHLEGK